MNKIIIAISLILISFSINSQSGLPMGFYSGSHDSLLFDGSNEITTQPISSAKDCYIRVIYVHGSAKGTYYVTKTYNVCGEIDTSVRTKKGELSPLNELKLGSEITTGDDSGLEMQFWDGSIIRLGPNSKITITGNMCESQTLVHLVGKMWTNVKKLLGSQKYEVKTESFIVGVRGTQFSVETTNDGEIVEVYEGSVTFQKNLQSKENKKKAEDEGAEGKKLAEDYKSGKISLEEFTKKAQEMQQEAIDFLKYEVTVNAGFQSKIVGTENPTEPVPIESTGNEWFDDVNFKK